MATGEMATCRREHENEEARKSYTSLGEGARVGIEATGCAQWLERLLAELGDELWAGDAAKIRACVVRRQERSARDAWWRR